MCRPSEYLENRLKISLKVGFVDFLSDNPVFLFKVGIRIAMSDDDGLWLILKRLIEDGRAYG